jgi:RNA-binding protein
MAVALSTKQRAYLRSLGQPRQPLFNVGRDGVTEGTRQALDELLTRHELVKGRMQKTAEGDPREIAAALAGETDAALVGVVGRTFLVYRPNPQPKDPIRLPE